MKIHYKIIGFEPSYLEDLTSLALDLWPNHEFDEMKKSLEKNSEETHQKFFLCVFDDLPIGFIHASLRFDYVEGAHSSPVGYIEGVYVLPEFRKKGISRALTQQAENWAKEKGCLQMGSDMEEENQMSYAYHMGVGFKEANRVICFIKNIM